MLAARLPHALFVAPDGPEPRDMAPYGRQWFSLQDRRPAVMLAGARRTAPLLDAYLDELLQRHGLDEVLAQMQTPGHRSPELSHLQGVRQPGPRGVALAGAHHLRLVGQAAQCRTVQHPRAVPGEVAAEFGVRAGDSGALGPLGDEPFPVERPVPTLLVAHHRAPVFHGAPTIQRSVSVAATRLHFMRVVRLLPLLLVVLLTALLSAPAAVAEPPFRVQQQVTDNAGVLSNSQKREVQTAVDKLFNDRRIKLWVVYVTSFDDLGWLDWSKQTERLSDLGNDDALLAIATQDRSFAFNVDPSMTGGSSSLIDSVRRDKITPALRNDDWAGAAINAANGLNAQPPSGGGTQISGRAVLIAAAALVLLAVLLWWWIDRQSVV